MFRGNCYLLLLCLVSYCPLLAQGPGNRKVVDILHADAMRGVPHEGKTINRFVGNVQFMHNEAIMSCDSADLIGSNSFKAYGHILIIKNKTKLHGETLDYDGNINIGQVRGKLVRLEDEKAVLRTTKLDFNTKENTAYFYDGGTLADTGNILESDKGYYYSDKKLARFVEEVEMHNKEYEIHSDSLHYRTDKELAIFLGPTSIWHKDGYLSCEDGWYDKPRDYFYFSQKAYVLSEKQEMWADSIFYNRKEETSDLYGNIQVLDTTRSLLAFGDEAHLVNETQNILLTRRPAVAYYEVDEEGKSDTLFLRADTLRFVTVKNPAFYAKDTVLIDSLAVKKISGDNVMPFPDSLLCPLERHIFLLPLPTRPITLSPQKTEKEKQQTTLPKTNGKKNFGPVPLDHPSDSSRQDSTTIVPPVDSVLQYMYAFRNMRAFRSDGQAACDSLVYFLNDTLGEMYHNPVLWNDRHQISSDKIRFIAKNQEIEQIEFLNNAFVLSQEDTNHYNQVKSRDMYAHFRKNEMYMMDVQSNVQTIFFMAEDSVITDINFGESKNMQVYIHNRKMSRIKYLDSPNISVHPLYKVTKAQERLKGFNWRDADRPKSRYDICDRTIIPSQRKSIDLIPKPEFPITKRIDSIK